MSRLRLFLLGFPRVEYDGVLVGISRRKALALLAYLAVTKSSHSRSALATLLWPDNEPSRAYACLRNALWTLNQTPVAKWLNVDHKTVEIKRDLEFWLDTDQFRNRLMMCQAHNHSDLALCPACLSLLTEAVDLYNDRFLSNFGLGDSVAFDEWQFFETEALQQELAGALEKLISIHRKQGVFESAIAYARRWLALDPLNEVVYRHLMKLYVQSGQRNAALRQYRECTRIFDETLGLAPGPETIDLHKRILAGELSTPEHPQDKSNQTVSAPQQNLALIPLSATAQFKENLYAPTMQEETTVSLYNLPPQTTSLVGRNEEMAEIGRLLTNPDCRLLTLVGLGGSGKTRLAIQAANERVSAFSHGVCFVPLAQVGAPEFVVLAMADALHIPLSRCNPESLLAAQKSSERFQMQILGYLCEKQMLLVLDSVEHLLSRPFPTVCGKGSQELEGVELLIRKLYDSAPGIKFLVTSRERLNLHGEWVLEVVGLPFPPEDTLADEIETYDAVQLFLHSARRTHVGFSLTKADMIAVARICRLVEGMPLGIELAAAWIKVLSCQEIAAEIEANLDFLTTSLWGMPERHHSLRTVFAQSRALVPEDRDACFRKLSIFRDGFTREAAEEVAEVSLADLASLVDKSLLRRTPNGRYEMPRLLRQYTEEQLEAVPHERDIVCDRHCRHYLALLRRLETALKSGKQGMALQTLSREMGNIQAAWRWAATHGKVERMQMAAFSLFLFYDIRSDFRKGAGMFKEAATALNGQNTKDGRALLGLLLATQGWFTHFSSFTKAQDLFKRSLEHLEPLGSREELALANVLSALASKQTSSNPRTKQRLQESLTIYEAQDNCWGIALTLNALAHHTLKDKDATMVATTELCAQQSLELRCQLEDRWGMAMSLSTLGEIAEKQEMLPAAWNYYCESLGLRQALGEDLAGVVDCLLGMGRVAHKMGDYDQAWYLFLNSLTFSQEIKNRWYTARSLYNLGLVACKLRKHQEAQNYLCRSLALFEKLGVKINMASSKMFVNSWAAVRAPDDPFVLNRC